MSAKAVGASQEAQSLRGTLFRTRLAIGVPDFSRRGQSYFFEIRILAVASKMFQKCGVLSIFNKTKAFNRKLPYRRIFVCCEGADPLFLELVFSY
jgi:hypothetical protein